MVNGNNANVAQVPTVYHPERIAFPPTFCYNITLEDGNYYVKAKDKDG
tara:strand:- start:278 stop:421 length:144 start_codon:yes stop_codon:yes gene_type:complete